jgi:hypothetical protein
MSNYSEYAVYIVDEPYYNYGQTTDPWYENLIAERAEQEPHIIFFFEDEVG